MREAKGAEPGTCSDGIVTLVDSPAGDLADICRLERGPSVADLVAPYDRARHEAGLADPAVCYQSIRLADGTLAGFVILCLDDDGESVELRRIVVARPGRGTGRRALHLVEKLCRERLGRRRIWLDVYPHNQRARHVYEACGYRHAGQSTYQGRPVELYEKRLSASTAGS